MSRKLRELLDAGKLHELAVGCKRIEELAAKVGMSSETYSREARRLRAGGVAFPTWEQLHANGPLPTAGNSGDRGNDFADEEPTRPGVPDLGMNQPDLGTSYRDLDTGIGESIPSGHFLKGRSTLRDASGAVVMQWDKTSVTDQHYREALLLAVSDLAHHWQSKHEPIPAPPPRDEDLLAAYIMGDPHLGLLCWGEEVGANHDLAIAERDMCDAVDHLVSLAPDAETGLVCMLGDNLHFDNERGETTAGTRQDADTRWYKVMRTAIRGTRRCIDRGLEKHAKMDVRIIRGNHDRHSAAMLALAIAQYYERDERVFVDLTPDPYSWKRFGKCLIGMTHSDECSKADDLAGVMAVDRAEDWGQTLYRYILAGHLHHETVKETRGVVVERFPTLAPRDRWHHGKGYRAQQTMCVDTYHREWGRVNRSTVGIRQLRARSAG